MAICRVVPLVSCLDNFVAGCDGCQQSFTGGKAVPVVLNELTIFQRRKLVVRSDLVDITFIMTSFEALYDACQKKLT